MFAGKGVRRPGSPKSGQSAAASSSSSISFSSSGSTSLAPRPLSSGNIVADIFCSFRPKLLYEALLPASIIVIVVVGLDSATAMRLVSDPLDAVVEEEETGDSDGGESMLIKMSAGRI